jgi:hypothetical protein
MEQQLHRPGKYMVAFLALDIKLSLCQQKRRELNLPFHFPNMKRNPPAANPCTVSESCIQCTRSRPSLGPRKWTPTTQTLIPIYEQIEKNKKL